MYSFFSAKGGAGCSVAAAAAAVLSAHTSRTLLVDCCGDQAALLGIDAGGPGLSDWCRAPVPPADALQRIETVVSDHLSLLAVGSGEVEPSEARARELVELLRRDGRRVIVDIGTRYGPMAELLEQGERSLLVTRPCYLALRSSDRVPVPDGIVLVTEPGRALRRGDVEAAVEAPVLAELGWDPRVARAVDAGLLLNRIPETLKALKQAL